MLFDLIARLEEGLDPVHKAAIAQAMSFTDGIQFSRSGRGLAAVLRHALIDDGLRKIDDFTDRHQCITVEFTGKPDPFMNLNRLMIFI